jgi:hypothetical protein
MKNMLILLLIGNLNAFAGYAQNDTSRTSTKIWGYADIYYAWDFNKPAGHIRPFFIYSHNRHNEFALNNGVAGIKHNQEKIRGAIALHTGTYVRANYAAEPDLLKLIYEANAGLKICKNLWLDAGVFSSHIGAESALSLDNPTLTRSIMAENTPYYESGVRLTNTQGKKWMFSGLILNGWQNIAENNNNKALGTQIQFKPATGILINSSTFYGKENAGYDSIPTMRYFHNLYTQIEVKKITILAAFDIGLQEKRLTSGTNLWYNTNLIISYTIAEKFSLAGRLEYYHDKHGVIINTETPDGFKTLSPSLNIDYKPAENLAMRVEGRLYDSRDKIFTENGRQKNIDYFIICSLAAKFRSAE